MSSYKELKDAMAKKVQAAGSSRYSKGDHIALTHSLLNTPDYEVDVYIKDGDKYETTKTTPVKNYRESLKPVIAQFGVDKAELDKIHTVEFPKGHAEAFNDLAEVAMKDYISTGRKLIFPVNSEDESQLELSQFEVPEKIEDTSKLVEESPGNYKRVPTGDRKTTKKHTAYKAANKVPAWLVSKEKIQ